MPEYPDIAVYVRSLQDFIGGSTIRGIRLVSPSLLRSYEPPISAFVGRSINGVRSIGKQIVWDCGEEHYLVFHLMIAGRFHWKKPGAAVSRRTAHAGFDFDTGTLLLTEASTRKRASLHAVHGQPALRPFDRGGIDIFACTGQDFIARLLQERHTLKRSLTDPRLFSGIGNAYSDEILHRAGLSPLSMSTSLDETTCFRLLEAARSVLKEWEDRLWRETKGSFPERVTAFHTEMAVHGRFGQPCPVCGSPVQRIVYSENECNYCARCQTGGKILADRSLSRLLKDDWPRSIDELTDG